MKIIPAILFRNGTSTRRGFLEVDLAVGLAILALAIMPIGYSFIREREVLRAEYFHSAAMEIVDGEMEVLAAGDWKNFPNGSQNYVVHGPTADRLPPGHFQLTKTGHHLRLEWSPIRNHGIPPVVREITIK
jgi:hypothetical protein